ncbi:MAG: hypothetical protein EYC62_00910 [Alphaproteobacteria bacterium]|nr:MAG: hypothetical protein EYC62_00910 [Alphaproteobacteria bacterium]
MQGDGSGVECLRLRQYPVEVKDRADGLILLTLRHGGVCLLGQACCFRQTLGQRGEVGSDGVLNNGLCFNRS